MMGKTTLDEADFVIVGTGAGGATAARVLSDAGFELALVEEGAFLTPADRPKALVDAMALAVRGMATMSTDSLVPMPLLSGKCVGGSTAINSGIVWRTPDDVRDDWRAQYGLGHLVGDALDGALDRIEADLFVHPTDEDILGENSGRMRAAAEKLGLPGRVIRRNVTGCRGSNRCLQGCPNAARQSMEVSYVPKALAHGARLHTRCKVERVLFERGRTVGVRGTRTTDAGTREPFEVRARLGVIVAGGALFSPVLLQRSGVRHPNLGERFQAHPGAAFVGAFESPVHMGFGASQGYEVPMRAQGFKLEALSLPPDMLAARLPGAGAEWQERVARLGHYAQWGGLARMEAKGRVRSGFFDGVSVRYEPTARDLMIVRDALLLVGRMMFAAGAYEVYPGIVGIPEIVKSEAELMKHLEHRTIRRPDVHLVASHLFGTTCASSDPSVGVLDEELRVRGVDGLFVMDASALPTNLGVNPQHTIMGVVHVAAERLAERASRRAAA